MLYSFSSIGGVIGAAYAMVLFEIVALVGYIAVSVVKKNCIPNCHALYNLFWGNLYWSAIYIAYISFHCARS